MTTEADKPTQSEAIAELVAVIRLFWAHKIGIVLISGLFAVGSVFFALSLPNQYKASLVVAPSASSVSAGLSGAASQLSGLAALGGIDLGGGSGTDNVVLAVQLLRSWSFIDQFIKSEGIQAEVFAANGWNLSSGELGFDEELFDAATGDWVREFDPSKGQTAEPSSWELYQEFAPRLSVVEDRATGLVTISFEYYSPTLATEWLLSLVQSVNEHIRERERESARRSIEFLTSSVDETSLAEMRAVLYQLMEEQTKRLMLTEVNEEYVFSVLSPPLVPEEKSSPPRALICIAGTFLGFLLGCVFAFARDISARSR